MLGHASWTRLVLFHFHFIFLLSFFVCQAKRSDASCPTGGVLAKWGEARVPAWSSILGVRLLMQMIAAALVSQKYTKLNHLFCTKLNPNKIAAALFLTSRHVYGDL